MVLNALPIRRYNHQGFIKILPLLLGVLTFIFYFYTLAPTVIWGDSAKLTQFIYERKLSVRPEYHPLHTLVGIFFSTLPFDDYAFRINLLSAFFGSLTVIVTYLIVYRLSKSIGGAIAGAGSLAVSHIFWHLSVMAETYTLFSFLFTLTIMFVLIWDDKKDIVFLCIASFIFGLSLSNNYLMPFLLPGFIYFYFFSDYQDKFNKKKIIFIVISFFIGFSVWIIIALLSYKQGSGALLDILQGGAFVRYYRSISKLITETLRYPLYLFYQFPFVGFVAGIYGVWYQKKENKHRLIFLLLLFISNIIFASGYMRQKQFYLLIASYIIFSIWLGIGFSVFCSRVLARKPREKILSVIAVTALILSPVFSYYTTPFIVSKMNLDIVGARKLAYRNNPRFFLLPDKQNEYGAQRYANEAFELVEPNSIVVADFTPIAVLRYFQNVLGERKDVLLKLVDFEPLDVSFVDRHIKERSIYLADDLEPDYNISGLKKKYSIIPIGPIWKLDPIK